ncbi:MAG: ABC transporter substrate-binding protein, partial [Burkholderiales bacterium]
SVIVVNDQSTDATAALVKKAVFSGLKLIEGQALAGGWSGKLWTLEQGRQQVTTPLLMLLDADIELRPGLIAALREHMQKHNAALVSLMAAPTMTNFWEKLLMPAFVYFFKMLYPFRLSNSEYRGVAAAAGGCILLKNQALEEIGGFAAIKDELIDDCALAKRIKLAGHKTWIGLTHSAQSIRPYQQLRQIWNMVTRTAFTQLHYSMVLLLLCSALMALAFAVPAAGLVAAAPLIQIVAAIALTVMTLSYLPILGFYGRSPLWALSLPFVAILYLVMTWDSAWRYFRGERSRWKGRVYERIPARNMPLTAITLFLTAGLLLVNLATPAYAAAAPDNATAVIERFQATLISVMADAQKLGYEGRYKKLAPAIEESHDLAGIAQFAAGRYWEKLSDAQKKSYVDTFGKLSMATYAYRFDGYSGESFKALSEEATGNRDALVHTLLSTPNGEKIRFDYVLRRKDGNWRIINIIVDGVSDLAIKRSEYGNILRDQGGDVLITKMQGQIAQYSKSGEPKK